MQLVFNLVDINVLETAILTFTNFIYILHPEFWPSGAEHRKFLQYPTKPHTENLRIGTMPSY